MNESLPRETSRNLEENKKDLTSVKNLELPKNSQEDFDILDIASDTSEVNDDDIAKLRKKIEEHEEFFAELFDKLFIKDKEEIKAYTAIDNLSDENLNHLINFIKNNPKYPGVHRLIGKMSQLLI
jgi:hypothetical protein